MVTNVTSFWTTTTVGLLVGSAWSLANLWVLGRLLTAWISPAPRRSRRRVVGWLLLKLAVIYPLAVLFLHANPGAAVSFGVGFSLVLLAALIRFTVVAQRAIAHGP